MKKPRIALTLDQVKVAFEGLTAGGGNYCVLDEYEEIDKEGWKTPTISKPLWPPEKLMASRFNSGTDYHLYNEWFRRNIEPLGRGENVMVDGKTVYREPCPQGRPYTARAILIGIEPINEVTAEDLLREFVASAQGDDFSFSIRNLLIKATAYFQEKK